MRRSLSFSSAGLAALLTIAGCQNKDSADSPAALTADYYFLNGVTNDGGTESKFVMNLVAAGKTWKADEADGGSNVFKTKSGTWIYAALPDGSTLLQKPGGETVARLTGFQPGVSKVNDSGRFYNEETGRTGRWTYYR